MLATGTSARVGRKMEFPDRITLPLAEGVLARIDGLLLPDEPRLDLIRHAIDMELTRRATLLSKQRQAEARMKSSKAD